MEREQVALVLMGGAVLLGAGAALQAASQGTSSTAADEFRFASAPLGPGNVYRWGIQRESTPFPATMVDTADWTETADLMARGEVDMADVTWANLPRVLAANPDVRILPYQINTPLRSFAIWVPSDSSITAPGDLDGRTIAAPVNVTGEPRNVEAAVLLRAGHGVNATWVRRDTAGEAALDALAEDDIDAALLVGETRLPDDHDLRPVFLPQKMLRDRFGDAGLPRFFVVRDDPASIAQGIRVVQALQVSAGHAQRSRDAFMDAYWYCNEFLVELADDPQIERMTPGFHESRQFLFSTAHQQGVLQERVNLSRWIVREPVSRTP